MQKLYIMTYILINYYYFHCAACDLIKHEQVCLFLLNWELDLHLWKNFWCCFRKS